MSEARTIWHDMAARRGVAIRRKRSGMALAVALLCAMAAAEVLFLTFVAGPDSVGLVAAAEGVPMPQ
ncbi:MAG: hypothetical protein JO209_07655 [Acidisphaera sp.]|nr:hypothetical protein [Acidisphaera sp.]